MDNVDFTPLDPTNQATPVGTPREGPYGINTVVSVSTTFHPGAQLYTYQPDVVIVSCDEVFFYTHSQRLAAEMENHPTGLLSSNTLTRDRAGSLDIVVLPEPSSVVNVMLHTVYGIPCNQYLASIAVLRATLHALVKYGLPPRTYLSRNAVLYALLLAQIPVFPLEVYTLAAEYNIHELAVAASACLIDLDIPSVSDETVTRMGVAYFMRLCALAQRRKDILRALIFVPPVVPAHRDGYIQCDGVAVTPAWSRAVADLVWEATPSISPERLRSAFSSFKSITCSYCRKCWATRVDEIVNAWSAAPRTI